jgi:serine/threonine protein kinase
MGEEMATAVERIWESVFLFRDTKPKVHLLASGPPYSSHMVALHAAFEDAQVVHLVLDLCEGRDLLSLFNARNCLPGSEAARIAAQLASRPAPSLPSRPRPRISCAACSAGTSPRGSPSSKYSGIHGS